MQLRELMTKVNRLPPECQQEVVDFVAFLEMRYGKGASPKHTDWSEQQFQTMSIDQAMKGLEHEPDLYSDEDLKERWR